MKQRIDIDKQQRTWQGQNFRHQVYDPEWAIVNQQVLDVLLLPILGHIHRVAEAWILVWEGCYLKVIQSVVWECSYTYIYLYKWCSRQLDIERWQHETYITSTGEGSMGGERTIYAWQYQNQNFRTHNIPYTAKKRWELRLHDWPGERRGSREKRGHGDGLVGVDQGNL